MVQIHPSLPLTNTHDSHASAARNPLQFGGVGLQPVFRSQFLRILFESLQLALSKEGAAACMFPRRPRQDLFDSLEHVLGV